MSLSAPRVILCLALLSAASEARAAPRWLRLSWTGPSDSTMTVSWSDDATGSGSVEYRLGGGAVQTATATPTATGSADLGTTYVARLTGLQPASAYLYRVSSSGAWSTWRQFHTPPAIASCDPVRFVAAGDSRGQDLPLVGYVASLQWADIATAMALEQAVFALHTGDFVYDGSKAPQWVTEMPRLEPLSSRIPFFLVMGNHDDGPGEGAGAHFNLLFDYPANGPAQVDDYFSFVVGNVLVVGLSTYTYSMDAQITWLRAVLEAHRADADWRVIFFHTPVWSSGSHGNNEDNRTRAAALVPLLDEYGVELVLNGHDHDYERFHPSRGGWGGVTRVVTPLAHDNGRRGTPQGTIYIVTGGGGAIGDPLFNPGNESAYGSKHLHYILLETHGGQMTLSVRDCGAQGLGGATCSGDLEVVTLEKPSARCAIVGQDGGVDGGLAPDGGQVKDGGPAADGGPDAGVPEDAGAPGDGGISRDGGGGGLAAAGGCGCRSAEGQGGLLPMLLLAAWLWSRRRRSRVS